MKRLIAPLGFVLVVGCAGGLFPKSYDSYHRLYNEIVPVALTYAESTPDASEREAIVKVVRRTAPVVIHGAQVLQRKECATDKTQPGCLGVGPVEPGDETYLTWARPLVRQAILELTEAQSGNE